MLKSLENANSIINPKHQAIYIVPPHTPMCVVEKISVQEDH